MKIALITGGSRGLGKSSALHTASRGVGVILTYHSNRAEAEAVVKEIENNDGKAIALQLDTAKIASFEGFAKQVREALKEKWGRDTFDYLVNNAGTALYAPIESTTEEQFDTVVNVHLKGVYFLTQKLLPLIADGGQILNISSGLARFSMPGSSAYAMMKGAIEVFTRYLAKELGPRKIRANTVAPGAIATDFGGGRVRDDAALNKQVASITNLGRVGEADDIGLLIASLLSEDSRWVNAQRIEASGGMLS